MGKRVQQLFNISGQVAIITGGSRGLGKEIARGLGEAGAKLVITARREEWLKPTQEEFAAAGFECLAFKADVGNPANVNETIQATLQRFNRLDILVNNAGQSWGQPAHEMPLEKWEMVMRTNSTGTFLMSQAAAKYWIKQGRGGKIVNISSVAGLHGGDPDVMTAAAYNASKGAIISLTRVLASEWGPKGININAVAPGFFPSRLTRGVLDHAGEEAMAERVPLKRLGGEDDLKGVVLFLASEAGGYISGQVIPVDGGRT